MTSIINSTKSFITSPRGQMISGAVVASLPHIKQLRPMLGSYSVPAAVIGMGLMAYAGLEKASQDAVKLSDKTKQDMIDVRIKTQAKWTPIEISELSTDNLKKMKNEKPLLPEAVQEKINTQLEEIGNWKSNIGVNGISQTYQSALLYGPTGSGKSSVARQMMAKFDDAAKDDNRTHYHIKIEPTMLSSEHGNAKLGKLLDDIKAKVTTDGADKVAFSILMDECDGALKVGLETANQYNTMIDAFTKEMNVPILQILTTNHLDEIDARTIRLGRCGTKIEIPNPDEEAKEKIMKQAFEQFTYNGKTLKEIIDLLHDKLKLFTSDLPEKPVDPMNYEVKKFIENLRTESVDCQVYNPATRENEKQTTSLNDLLKDKTISGATISEITLQMLKKLTTKAYNKHKDKSLEYILKGGEPSNLSTADKLVFETFKKFIEDFDPVSMTCFLDDLKKNNFIQEYGVKEILSDAIGEALTQKALEEHNKAKA